MFEKSLLGPQPLPTTVKVMLTAWFVILVPWLPVFTLMGTGMAFESGYTFRAYAFAVMAWAYPALVFVAFYFRRRKPDLVWLPLLATIPLLASVWPSN